MEMLLAAGIILGPCVGYVFQGLKIWKSGDASGFSPYACFILIASNLIRIFWWRAAQFSAVLLAAAIIMVDCQIVLLFIWVSTTRKTLAAADENATSISV